MTSKRIVRFSLLIAWLGLTIFLSQQAGVNSAILSKKLTYYIQKIIPLRISFQKLHTYLREFAHFGIHFVLAILAYRAFLTVASLKPSIIICLVLCDVIACFDEWIQIQAIGRYAEFADMILNLFGVCAGTIIGIIISKPLYQKPPQ